MCPSGRGTDVRFSCQSAPINPKNAVEFDDTAFAIAWRLPTDGKFFNDAERRAEPVSPSSDFRPRDRRLRRRADFDRVFQHGRHNSARLLAVRSIANESLPTRYAFAIPKRVGKAVTRNKVRRRLREILRLLPMRENFDIVISVRPAAAEATFFSLKTELSMLLKRARILDIPA